MNRSFQTPESCVPAMAALSLPRRRRPSRQSTTQSRLPPTGLLSRVKRSAAQRSTHASVLAFFGGGAGPSSSLSSSSSSSVSSSPLSSSPLLLLLSPPTTTICSLCCCSLLEPAQIPAAGAGPKSSSLSLSLSSVSESSVSSSSSPAAAAARCWASNRFCSSNLARRSSRAIWTAARYWPYLLPKMLRGPAPLPEAHPRHPVVGSCAVACSGPRSLAGTRQMLVVPNL
mmetsp:Transcript_18522/g.42587  ORF Transcript_18522/g.42587 Transcript_18522/m.42587 type:complete len:228 (+) Transcript_18522:114-797(+)